MASRKKARRGVYTVEASILIPLLLFVIATGMRLGIALYKEAREATEQERVESAWAVGDFYKSYWIKEAIDE